MNNCCFIGNLVRDPQIRTKEDGSVLSVRFTLAVNRAYQREGQPTADYINHVAFGAAASFLAKGVENGSIAKGTKLETTGRWQTGSYQNDQGQTIYTNDCFVQSVSYGESKKAAEERRNSGQPAPAPAEATAPQAEAPQTDSDGFMNLPPDAELDLPFK